MLYIVLFSPIILINLLLFFKIKKYFEKKQTESHVIDLSYCFALAIVYYSYSIFPILILGVSNISEVIVKIIYSIIVFSYLILTLIIVIFHFIYKPSLEDIDWN